MPEGKINNKVYFKYYTGVTEQSRYAVKNTVSEFLKRAGKNAEFINGYTFSIVNKFKDLPVDTLWKKTVKLTADQCSETWGITNTTVVDSEKSIVMQAKAHASEKNIFNGNTNPKFLETCAMHKIGHVFDNYYGKKNKELVDIVKNFHLFKHRSEPEERALKLYMRNKDLSDSKEFKKAWLKDATTLGKDKNKYDEFKKNGIRRYLSINEIDITDGITKQEIENADRSRAEIFAHLFAYALGKDDGQKEEILAVYPNTYKCVQKYISKYLGIKN